MRPNFSAWKALLTKLRDIRLWGPQDRVTAADRAILAEEYSAAIGAELPV